jgi:hypothetical protein
LTVSGTVEVAGEVAAAASAMAGLILVFLLLIGVISGNFRSSQKAEQKAPLTRYQRWVRSAFAGFMLALLSTILALIANWRALDSVADVSLVLSVVALMAVFVAAFFAVRQIV